MPLAVNGIVLPPPLIEPVPETVVPVCESVRLMVTPDPDPDHDPFTFDLGDVLPPHPAMASARKSERNDRRMGRPWWRVGARTAVAGCADRDLCKQTTNGEQRHKGTFVRFPIPCETSR